MARGNGNTRVATREWQHKVVQSCVKLCKVAQNWGEIPIRRGNTCLGDLSPFLNDFITNPSFGLSGGPTEFFTQQSAHFSKFVSIWVFFQSIGNKKLGF
jgi:hypothetical protein